MKRINVIGTSGSGKSHFSRRLAEALESDYIQLDAMHWQPDWTPADDNTFFSELEGKLRQEAWVLDGNYSKTNTIKWKYVDTIIWLDYSFLRTFLQILKRSVQRAWSKQEIWPGTGNRESFRRNFLSHDSVILWMLTSYAKTKDQYTKLLQSNGLEDIEIIHITSPRQADAFIKQTASNSVVSHN